MQHNTRKRQIDKYYARFAWYRWRETERKYDPFLIALNYQPYAMYGIEKEDGYATG